MKLAEPVDGKLVGFAIFERWWCWGAQDGEQRLERCCLQKDVGYWYMCELTKQPILEYEYCGRAGGPFHVLSAPPRKWHWLCKLPFPLNQRFNFPADGLDALSAGPGRFLAIVEMLMHFLIIYLNRDFDTR